MASEIARVSRCNLKLIFQTSNFAQRVLYKYIISDKAFFTQSKTSLQLAFLSVPFHIGTSKKGFFADLCQSEQLIHQRQQSCISEFSHTVGRTRGLFAGCSWRWFIVDTLVVWPLQGFLAGCTAGQRHHGRIILTPSWPPMWSQWNATWETKITNYCLKNHVKKIFCLFEWGINEVTFIS